MVSCLCSLFTSITAKYKAIEYSSEVQYLSEAKQWKKGQMSIVGTRLEIKNADSPKIVIELTRSTKMHIHKESSPTPFTFVVKYGNTAIPVCVEKESVRR